MQLQLPKVATKERKPCDFCASERHYFWNQHKPFKWLVWRAAHNPSASPAGAVVIWYARNWCEWLVKKHRIHQWLWERRPSYSGNVLMGVVGCYRLLLCNPKKKRCCCCCYHFLPVVCGSFYFGRKYVEVLSLLCSYIQCLSCVKHMNEYTCFAPSI